ncbi:hypothetical protein F5J12DRAFT_894233 [Pisolithus orientalis]|uniref:uncharacterized protein n=1 Tax=Pisolithus orientalis TaxID=936130 RepID=UPI002225646A|nr:uncharacterized protein F5J12DRAFT_894233 [Pisolithus orientalis]KAI6002471.1 hypothetical protein F5J12DRAFT_894233 [Pisolithus orientalis]
MGTFQHATTSEVATLSTAIIHLHLDGLTMDPDPFHIIQSMIQGYFKQEGTYNFAQLPYDLGTQESRAAYETAAEVLSSFLAPYGRVVLFFTTNSEEQSGDLFAGSRDGQVFVSRVFEVLEALLTPLSKVVEGGDLIFLVCGYLVKHQESFQDLKSAMNHFKPRSMLLFDADRLLPINTIPFLMSVLDLTIIQGFQQMDKTVKAALKDCGVLGRHSNIILMFWGSQGGRVLVERYIWTDKFIKPWGQNLPAQCPQHGSIQEWLAASADSTYSYQCQYPDCGKDLEGTALPPKTYTISMPQGAKKLLDGKKSSAWELPHAEARSANTTSRELPHAEARLANATSRELTHEMVMSANTPSRELPHAEARSADTTSRELTHEVVMLANTPSRELPHAEARELTHEMVMLANTPSRELPHAEARSADTTSRELTHEVVMSADTPSRELPHAEARLAATTSRGLGHA